MKQLLNALVVALAVLPICTQAQTLSDSLVAYFPLDGSPNDVFGGLTPTVTSGNPSFCTDRFGNADGAACFDGASFWSYGDVLDMDTSDFSITCWVLADTVHIPTPEIPFSSDGILICKGTTLFGTPSRSGYSLAVLQPTAGLFQIEGATGDSNTNLVLSNSTFDLDEWRHVILTRCGIHQFLYINGMLVADSITVPSRNISTNIVFTLGAVNRDPTGEPDSGFFTGALDDVRIYKGRCLSQPEIDTLFYGTSVAVQEVERSSALRLHPNPAVETLSITSGMPMEGSTKLIITDATGRVVMDRVVGPVRTTSNTTINLDVTNLMPGAYVLSLIGTEQRAFAHFIRSSHP
ncbi:MAG: LamG-like jellyroll fold domain-containing protein [Flavobacteriales bacterium]